MGSNIKIDVDEGLIQLSKGVRKTMRISLNAMGSPIKAAIISSAPARHGFLKKSIRIKSVLFKDGNGFLIVGPSRSYVRMKGKIKTGEKKGQRIRHRPAYIVHIVEKHRGNHQGFIQDAANSSKGAALARFHEKINEEIAKQSTK